MNSIESAPRVDKTVFSRKGKGALKRTSKETEGVGECAEPGGVPRENKFPIVDENHASMCSIGKSARS